MLADCCTTFQDCCLNAQDCCPALYPYVGYIFLGFLSFVLFVLWRRAASAASYVKVTACPLQVTGCCKGSVSSCCLSKPSATLDSFAELCDSAMERQQEQQTETLRTIKEIVKNLADDDCEDD